MEAVDVIEEELQIEIDHNEIWVSGTIFQSSLKSLSEPNQETFNISKWLWQTGNDHDAEYAE